jgi:hypothetical protein
LSPNPSDPKQNNIILFPLTIEHHLNQAIEAGNEKKYEQALHHYYQILQYEPKNVSGKMGLAITWMEMNKLRDVIDLTSDMLDEGEGDYYHILRIHVAALLQAEQYSQLKSVLTDTLARNDVPASFRTECETILEACQYIHSEAESVVDPDSEASVIQRRLAEQPHLIDHWIDQLVHGEVEQQFMALEQLQYTTVEKGRSAIRQWLAADDGDPLLKTLALRTLHKMGEEGTISFTKWGRTMIVDLSTIPLEVDEFPTVVQDVLQSVNDISYHKDPMIGSFSAQVWMEYLFTIYPDSPAIDEPKMWAAALHFITVKRLYEQVELSSICEEYQVPMEEAETIVLKMEAAISSRGI